MNQEQEINQLSNSNKIVLVTGASGYLAGHVIYTLLEKGFKVRGTVRSLNDSKKITHIKQINPQFQQNLELVEANLLDNTCWDKVVPGSYYICHVASPFPSKAIKNENDVILPAVNGTTAIMNAALKYGVKKIVITSSIVAVSTGNNSKNNFTSNDWSILQNSPAYEKSKHMAEKVAWKIYHQNRDKIKLTIINPGLIQGPTFHSNQFTSGDLIIRVLNNQIPGIPKISLPFVDVRDVALAHVVSLQKEDLTNGKRYLLVEGSYWFEDAISILRDEFEPKEFKIPSMSVGKVLFNIACLFDDQAKLLKPYWNRLITYDNLPSRTELGIIYTSVRKTLIDTAYSLIEKGKIKVTMDKTKLKNQSKL